MKPQWQRRWERLVRFDITASNGRVVRRVATDPQPRHRMPSLPQVQRW